MLLNYNLSDEELIERLLKVPRSTLKGRSVQEIIENLLSSQQDGSDFWLIKELCQRYGEQRLRTGEAFSKSHQVFDHFKIRLASLPQEMFFAVTLDNKHRIIKEHLISVGTINQSIVHPREVFAPAIELRAAAIILIHNHPSGEPTPSSQDIAITKRLVEVGEVVGIKVLDHVIIGCDCYYSFVDEELIF